MNVPGPARYHVSCRRAWWPGVDVACCALFGPFSFSFDLFSWPLPKTLHWQPTNGCFLGHCMPKQATCAATMRRNQAGGVQGVAARVATALARDPLLPPGLPASQDRLGARRGCFLSPTRANTTQHHAVGGPALHRGRVTRSTGNTRMSRARCETRETGRSAAPAEGAGQARRQGGKEASREAR